MPLPAIAHFPLVLALALGVAIVIELALLHLKSAAQPRADHVIALLAAAVCGIAGAAATVLHELNTRSAVDSGSVQVVELPADQAFTRDLLAREFIDDYVTDPEAISRIFACFDCDLVAFGTRRLIRRIFELPLEALTVRNLRARAKQMADAAAAQLRRDRQPICSEWRESRTGMLLCAHLRSMSFGAMFAMTDCPPIRGRPDCLIQE